MSWVRSSSMSDDAELEVVRILVIVRAACETAIERLDPSNVEHFRLLVRLHELCNLIDADFAGSTEA
jgi:hypothetical protein